MNNCNLFFNASVHIFLVHITSTADKGACFFEFKTNTHYLGGLHQIDPKTLLECMATCKKDTNYEEIYQDLGSQSSCWTHVSFAPKLHKSFARYTLNICCS